MAFSGDHVLSIQSSVVLGYVGNKCATFSLQVLGFDVSPINSVQLSNHTGYEHFKGQVLNAEDVATLFEGLKLNNLRHFSHVLTGYIGSKSFLVKVSDIIQDLKSCNANLIYVCDPVMGDNGKMYVPSELLPVYRDVIVPLADIITPNQYEAELLTDVKIHNEDDAVRVMQILHNKGPKTVVLSSTDLGAKGTLIGLASTVQNGTKECYRIQMPYYPAIFVGTGDLFTSCLLAWMHRDKSLKLALEKTVSTLQAVIKRTLESARAAAGEDKRATPVQMELKLIQSKSDIENPQILLEAVPL